MYKGRIHVGADHDVLESLSQDKNTIKISRRDFPYAIAKKLSGGTTVAGTMMIAHQVIKQINALIFFTTGQERSYGSDLLQHI